MNKSYLDSSHSCLARGAQDVPACLKDLIHGLSAERGSRRPDEWKEYTRHATLTHPITSILREDPFTRRALEKPRGYAGDAVMIDYVYGLEKTDEETERGRMILECLRQTSFGKAVQYRRQILAETIDRVAAGASKPRVLALACGHLREGHICTSLQEGRVGEFYALDHDPRSLAVVEREFGHLGAKCVHQSVLDLGFNPLGKFDLIYSAGLYDYLWQGAAKMLNAYSFEMLNSGGKLLVANVMPGSPDIGYMEAIMDWWLIYRTAEELDATANLIPADQIAGRRVFTDPTQCVAFLELTRK